VSGSRTRVALVGPGRLGTLIAHALLGAGMHLVHVSGGSAAARGALCGAIAGLRDVPLHEATHDVDLVVLAVPDGAIADVVDDLVRADLLDERHGVVHLSGALGLAPLRRAGLAGARIAACHPATTAPQGATDPALLIGIPWAVTAAPSDRAWAHGLVTSLGGDPFDVAEQHRVLYHAALTVASNAVGAAVVTARRLLGLAGIDRPTTILGPLTIASVGSALAGGAAALTGPVVRGDVATVGAHLDALATDMPELAEAYRAHARAVLAVVRQALAPDVVAELTLVLADPVPPADPSGPVGGAS
jgi:predicted short-subunit dehydrogenase-like oxidoreductase (DUF2520 family)